MKRNSHSFRVYLTSALIVCALLFLSAHLLASRATSQDPNATLPSPKKTAPPKKTTTTKTAPARKTTRPTSSGSKTLPRTRTNQAGIEFVLVPAGSFMMGSTDELMVRLNGSTNGVDSVPVHQVTISQPFYMGRYEVTQAQWQAVMGNNPSSFKDCGGNCPVEQVSWDDAQNFINKLNESNDGFRYRLPSEAEWEYACRAGTTGDYAGTLSEMAWYSDNSGSKTHAVGGKQPNAWGLADMHGNVWEWCQDWYHQTYQGAPPDGSAWLSGEEQKYRVMRGGSWKAHADGTTSAYRYWGTPDDRFNYLGFRVVAVR
jgi:formylglycine-generating enzyme required for sulfatase activity